MNLGTAVPYARQSHHMAVKQPAFFPRPAPSAQGPLTRPPKYHALIRRYVQKIVPNDQQRVTTRLVIPLGRSHNSGDEGGTAQGHRRRCSIRQSVQASTTDTTRQVLGRMLRRAKQTPQ